MVNGTGSGMIGRGAGGASVGDPTANGNQRLAAASSGNGSGNPGEGKKSIVEQLEEAHRHGRTLATDAILAADEEIREEIERARAAAADEIRERREFLDERKKGDEMFRTLATLRRKYNDDLRGVPKGAPIYRELFDEFKLRQHEIARQYDVDIDAIQRADPIVEHAELGDSFDDFADVTSDAERCGFLERIHPNLYDAEAQGSRRRTSFKVRGRHERGYGTRCYRATDYASSPVVRFVTWQLRDLQDRAMKREDMDRAQALSILSAGEVPAFADLHALLAIEANVPFPGERNFGCRLLEFAAPRAGAGGGEERQKVRRYDGFVEVALFERVGVRRLGIVRASGGVRDVLPISSSPIRAVAMPPWAAALRDHLLTITRDATLSDADVAARNAEFLAAGVPEACSPERAEERQRALAALRGEMWRNAERKWIARQRHIDATKKRIHTIEDKETALRALALLQRCPRHPSNIMTAAFWPRYQVPSAFETAVFVRDFPYDREAAAFAKTAKPGDQSPKTAMEYWTGVLCLGVKPIGPKEKIMTIVDVVGPLSEIVPAPGTTGRCETALLNPNAPNPLRSNRLPEKMLARLWSYIILRGFDELACGIDALRYYRGFVKQEIDRQKERAERRQRGPVVERGVVPQSPPSAEEATAETSAVNGGSKK